MNFTLGYLSFNSTFFLVDMSYEKKDITVLPEATDAFGRLNWRVYCRYCEEGEAGLMESLGFPPMYFYKKYGISFPRRAAYFEYFSQISPENLIDIKTEVKKVGTTSLTLIHTLHKKNRTDMKPILAATAEVTIVAYKHDAYMKTELPIELVDALKRLGIKKKD